MLIWCPECQCDVDTDYKNCTICGEKLETDYCKTCGREEFVDNIATDGNCFDCFRKTEEE